MDYIRGPQVFIFFFLARRVSGHPEHTQFLKKFVGNSSFICFKVLLGGVGGGGGGG